MREASERESALEKFAASATARVTEMEVALREASEREAVLERSAAIVRRRVLQRWRHRCMRHWSVRHAREVCCECNIACDGDGGIIA